MAHLTYRLGAQTERPYEQRALAGFIGHRSFSQTALTKRDGPAPATIPIVHGREYLFRVGLLLGWRKKSCRSNFSARETPDPQRVKRRAWLTPPPSPDRDRALALPALRRCECVILARIDRPPAADDLKLRGPA
jgi:hypothetical protein